MHQDRRQYARYAVRLPATAIYGTGDTPCPMHTRDISACGALVSTNRRFPKGSCVTLEILLENKTVEELTGKKCCVKVTGTIVRSDPGGVAVSFAEHRIMPLNADGA